MYRGDVYLEITYTLILQVHVSKVEPKKKKNNYGLKKQRKPKIFTGKNIFCLRHGRRHARP